MYRWGCGQCTCRREENEGEGRIRGELRRRTKKGGAGGEGIEEKGGEGRRRRIEAGGEGGEGRRRDRGEGIKEKGSRRREENGGKGEKGLDLHLSFLRFFKKTI